MLKRPSQLELQTVGGQAVIAGVMMRAPGRVSTAVRKPDGTIEIRSEPYVSLSERVPFLKLPVLRGAVGLVEMLVIGVRTLNYSAEIALENPNHGDTSSEQGEPASRDRPTWSLALTLALGLALGVGLFFGVPLLVATVAFSVDQQPLQFNLVAGAIRVLLFLGYLGGIALFRDIQRLFGYHGAEHKSIAALERGRELTVEAAMMESRFHPRCGTSFLLIVMLLAILLFALLDSVVMLWLGQLTLPVRLVTHLLLLPVVGGISYELLKLSARWSQNLAGRMLVAPGLWLQKITTREPTADQLEVAIAALKSACQLDQKPASIPEAALS